MVSLLRYIPDPFANTPFRFPVILPSDFEEAWKVSRLIRHSRHAFLAFSKRVVSARDFCADSRLRIYSKLSNGETTPTNFVGHQPRPICWRC
jgi:hypothetical protein